MRTSFVLGLDLGPPGEPTGFAVLERPAEPVDKPVYHLRHIDRFPAGTSYPDIVSTVGERINALPVQDGVPLVVDQTAVGKGVIDILRDVKSWLELVVVTAGQAVQKAEGGGHLVPKKELVTCLQLVLQSRRLKVAHGLPESDRLVAELSEFRLKKVSLSETDALEWRVRQQDDLVFAVALACWYAERHPPAGPNAILTGGCILDSFPPGVFRPW